MKNSPLVFFYVELNLPNQFTVFVYHKDFSFYLLKSCFSLIG
jgi:hypothetical protein